jgi:hypothetical protein
MTPAARPSLDPRITGGPPPGAPAFPAYRSATIGATGREMLPDAAQRPLGHVGHRHGGVVGARPCDRNAVLLASRHLAVK